MIIEKKTNEGNDNARDNSQEVKLVEYTQLAFFEFLHFGNDPNGFYEKPQPEGVLSRVRHIGGKFNRVECIVNVHLLDLFPNTAK
jgi:hypothetical protein